MADRYFVGGATIDYWDNPNHWSTTSGGAGGAGVPTAADDVYFDGNSPPDCDLDLAVADCNSFNNNNTSIDGHGNAIRVHGNCTVGADSTDLALIFNGAGAQAFTINVPIVFYALTIGDTNSPTVSVGGTNTMQTHGSLTIDNGSTLNCGSGNGHICYTLGGTGGTLDFQTCTFYLRDVWDC